MADVTNIGIVAKLGSIIVHLEEYLETYEEFDLDAAKGLLADPEVITVMGTLRAMALLPVKRDEKGKE